jgi:YesN/AraC family two-component response regulator
MDLVDRATDGRGGLEQYRRRRADITLMDVRLPDVSGIALIARCGPSSWTRA